MRSVVMRIFCHRQISAPFLLFIGAKYSEIGFEFLVYSFSFSIGLRMKCSAHVVINFKELTHFLKHFGCELWSSIRNNDVREAKSSPDLINKNLRCSESIDFLCTQSINYPLRKAMVYHNHDRIVSIG